ncbi:hypothetical protein EXIGLDRAFT_839970 [Exidia glandulosa HHB12029]|uniref:F-box domain-containing protein n=1 Tax=Exidia glandulosa HHB12029 TaxID=1314781 RepID=A0A165EPY3_EXIGL|nr:hypothetical protein EXIGLDRAFT_839970 [Exidia glandulosa HHB12029]
MFVGQDRRDSLHKAVQDILTDTAPCSGRHSSGSLSDARVAIYELVQQSLQEFSREINDRAPVNNLPAEILINILSYTSFYVVVAASRVCQLWRTTINDTASLWAVMISSLLWAYERPGYEFLRRTKDVPFDLSLRIRRPDSVQILQEHLPHIKRLTLTLECDYMSCDAPMHVIDELMYALRNPAPLLEELCILYQNSPGRRAFPTIPIDVFAGVSPRLHTVTAIGIRLPFHPYAAFSNVQRFIFRTPNRILGTDTTLSAIEMVQNIAGYRGLRHLAVLQEPQHPFQVGTADDEALVLALRDIGPQLDSLDCSYFPHLPFLLDSLSDSPPKLIAIHSATSEFLSDEWMRPDVSIVGLRFATRGSHDTAIEATDSSGYTRRITAVSMEPEDTENLWGFIPLSVFIGLTSLSMHEHMWPDDQPWPTSDSLQDLRIFLSTSYHRRVSEQTGGIFQLGIDQGPWHVPALKCLTLASILCTYTPHAHERRRTSLLVAADGIRLFLLQQLAPSPPQTLHLEHITLYEPFQSNTVRALHDLVQEITTSEFETVELLPHYHGHMGMHVRTSFEIDFS